MKSNKIIFIFFCLTFFSNVNALSLGDVELQSGFRQPLNAVVPVLLINEDETDQLSAALAADYAYHALQIEKQRSLNNISITLEDLNNNKVIRLRSSEPINDLFLDLILDVSTEKRRISNQYTLLFDLSEYNNRLVKVKNKNRSATDKEIKLISNTDSKAKQSQSMESSLGSESHDMKGSAGESHGMESSLGSESHDMKGSAGESHSMESSLGSESHDMKGSAGESHGMESSLGSESHDMKGSAGESHGMESSLGSESHDMKGSAGESHGMESSLGSESHGMESSLGSESHDMKGSAGESHGMESSLGSESHDMKGSAGESHSMDSFVGNESQDMKGSVN
ncbi:MAG: hypothetical protein AAF410_02630 [Pseudomonadota bacterium]